MTNGVNRIRLGLIGAGIIASEAHLPALRRLGEKFEITAVCNRTEPKAHALAEQAGLPRERVWTDWRLMLAEAPLDAVIICLPIELNYPVSEAAIRAGKHVLCEKPAGQSLAEARASVSLGRGSALTYMIAEDCHYTPSFKKAAELIGRGAVGRVNSIIWNPMMFMELTNKYARTGWRINHAYPGGYLLDGGVHNVHVLQMLAGPVESVKAEVRSVEKGLGVVDHAFCLLNHRNSVLSSLNLSWQAHDSVEAPIKVFGREGTLIVESKRIVRIDPAGGQEEIGFEEEDAFYLEQLDFHRAIVSGQPASCTVESTAHDVAVVLSLLDSAGNDSSTRVERVDAG